MKSRTLLLQLFIGCVILSACQPTKQVVDYSDEAEIDNMKKLAQEVFNLKVGEIERSGSQQNFVGIKTDNILVSKRLDSRTYFVQSMTNRPAETYQGTDEEYTRLGKELFNKLNIPDSEITKPNVLQENLQVAQFDTTSGKATLEEPEKGKKVVKFSRQIKGIPVFSSGMTLTLASNREISFLELHWPKIPESILHEAHRLKYKLEHGWKPPEQKGAVPESMEAGIVHSAAPGFLMDIYAAIRVIYKSQEPGVGRKLMLYFDRHGNIIPTPREFEKTCSEDVKRGKEDK